MNSETPATIFELENLSVVSSRPERTFLSDLSLQMKAGEILTVLGRDQSGRETLRDVLEKFLPPGAVMTGRLLLGEHADGKLPRFAYLPNAIFPALSPRAPMGEQLVRVLSQRTRLVRAAAAADFAHALERLPGAPKFDRLQSRSQEIAPRERVLAYLALALAQNPDAVLADDVVAGLDPTEAEEILRHLLEAQARHGFALVYFTSDPRIPLRLGGRIAVLRDGALVEEGPVAQLASSQAHSYTQALFESVPRLGFSEAPRASPRSEPLLQVRSLVYDKPKDRHARPPEGVTFDLRRGASMALVGERGSGRRDIIRAVLGLSPHYFGRIIFDAVDLGVLSSDMRARLRRRVAFITGDNQALDPRMTVYETVTEPVRMHINLGEEENRRVAESVLKRVGLGDITLRSRVRELNILDRRRLQIARALAGSPHLVVLYEPLAGLDAPGQALVLDLLKDFRRRDGVASITVTANFAVAEALAEEILVVKGREIIERGFVTELLRAPQQTYTAALIAAVSPQTGGLPPRTSQG
jgi:ABC-type glutathione transport system ATPase component